MIDRPNKPKASKPGTRGLSPLGDAIFLAILLISPVGLFVLLVVMLVFGPPGR